jgi:hypothetical protein
MRRKRLELHRTVYDFESSLEQSRARETFDIYPQGLPIFNFGREFAKKKYQDAIKITKQVGIGLLWIDCLCIVQDSEEDWCQESVSMELIYSNSFCNITAGLSNDRDLGCFFSRDFSQWGPFYVANPFSHPQEVYRVTVSEQPPPSIFSRGWVFQERLLCPRNVVFGEAMIWECREFGRSGLRPPVPEAARDVILDIKSRVSPYPEQRWEQMDFYFAWSTMVHRYSICDLTFSRDKLVALSGLAFAMSRSFPGDEYLAGMWKSQLPQGLLWHGNYKSAYPAEYRGPTWSWVAIDGGIGFDQTKTYKECALDELWVQIEKVFTIPAEGYGNDPRRVFARVKGGCIILHAGLGIVNLTPSTSPLTKFHIRTLTIGEQFWAVLSLSKHNSIFWQGNIDLHILESGTRIRASGTDFEGYSLGQPTTLLNEIIPGSIYCMPILCRPFTVFRPFMPDDGVHGLLLCYHCEGYFTRVGTFTLGGDKITELFKTLPQRRVKIL